MHHPSKRVQRTKSPERGWFGDWWHRRPQLPKGYGGRMPTNYWLRRAVCRLRRENYWLGRAVCELQLPAEQRVRRTEKEGLWCIASVFGKECTGRPGVAEQAKCSRRAAAHTTGWWNKRANADLQK